MNPKILGLIYTFENMSQAMLMNANANPQPTSGLSLRPYHLYVGH